MTSFQPVGPTQTVAVTSSTANTAFTDTSASYFLIQSDQVATGGRAFVALGVSGDTITATTGIAIHAGTEGLILKRATLQTHLINISTGSFNLFVTPVKNVS